MPAWGHICSSRAENTHTHVQLHNFQFQHAAKCVPSDSFVLPLSVCGGSGQNGFLSLTGMIIRNVDTSSGHAKGVAVTHPLCAPLHTVKIHQKDLRVTEHDPQWAWWITDVFPSAKRLNNSNAPVSWKHWPPECLGWKCMKVVMYYLPSDSSSSSSASRILTSSGTLKLSNGLDGTLESAILLLPLIQFLREGTH